MLTAEVPSLTVPDAAKRLGLNDKTVREMIARGDLAHYRIGRLIRLTEDDIAAYVESARRPAKVA